MHMLQSLFYLTIALYVSGFIITHLQEHKTTVTTASGNRYTVIDRVKCLHKTSMLIPYEQLFIQTFHHNGNLIMEQGTGEQNPLFQLAIDTMLLQQPHENNIRSTCHTHSNQFQLSHDSKRQQYGYVHHSLF